MKTEKKIKRKHYRLYENNPDANMHGECHFGTKKAEVVPGFKPSPLGKKSIVPLTKVEHSTNEISEKTCCFAMRGAQYPSGLGRCF